MQHVVITRIGLGRRDESFYQHHIELCAKTMAKSLDAQTCKDFIWAFAIDARAPAWVDDALAKLAPSVKKEIWRRDPFEVGLCPVNRERLIDLADGRQIITSRCDDDDLLHRSFITRAAEELDGKKAPTALSFTRGIHLSGTGALAAQYRWIGIGLCFLSSPQLDFHAYSFSHTTTATRVSELGGECIESSQDAMWIRTWRQSSDSSRAKGFRFGKHAKPTTFDSRDFGLSMIDLWNLKRTLRRDGVPEAAEKGVFQPQAYPRLFMKQRVLDKINEIRSSNPEDSEVELMAQLFYAL